MCQPLVLGKQRFGAAGAPKISDVSNPTCQVSNNTSLCIHKIYVCTSTYFYIHTWLIFMVSVSKYFSPMDPMGYLIKSWICWSNDQRMIIRYKSLNYNKILLMVQKSHSQPLVEHTVNNGINYQPQLVFSPGFRWFLGFAAPRSCAR